jgi:hypothetical protein
MMLALDAFLLGTAVGLLLAEASIRRALRKRVARWEDRCTPK